MLKHSAFISLEGNNIPLAKLLGQAHVYFGMDQKLGGKKEQLSSGGENHSPLGTNLSGKYFPDCTLRPASTMGCYEVFHS